RSRRIPDAAVGRRRPVPSRAGSGRRSSGLPGSTCHAAAVDRRGDAAVKQIITGLLVAAVTLTGCKKAPAPSPEMADMKDMQGMPGMPAAGSDTSGIPLDRAEAARLGITFARAAERPVRSSVRAVGILKYAEPNLVYVNARVGGWVERLYADYVGKRVEQGDPLLALYSPDLVSAQEEYLLARRLKDDTLAASARRRLALWDVPSDQIDSLETRGSVTRTLLLRAPRSGAVTEKMVIEGQAVRAGDNLFQIADARGGAAHRNEGPRLREPGRRPVRAPRSPCGAPGRLARRDRRGPEAGRRSRGLRDVPARLGVKPRRGDPGTHAPDGDGPEHGRDGHGERGNGKGETAMIERLIAWSIRRRELVALGAVFVLVAGVLLLRTMPVDATPDLSDTQVIVYTDWPRQAPQVFEDQGAYPLLTPFLAVPNVKVLRGHSTFSSSFVYVIFQDRTDLYWARSRVLEYLNAIQSRLPAGA